jgi:hypothetical protein
LFRTEAQALSILHDHRSLSGLQLFWAVQRLKEQIFIGDGSIYRMMADLSDARHPLVDVSDAPQPGLGQVSIAQTGRSIIEARADHIALKWHRSMARRRSSER